MQCSPDFDIYKGKGEKGVSLNPVSKDLRSRKTMSESREEHPSSRTGRNFALC